jgi:hypothetical protein
VPKPSAKREALTLTSAVLAKLAKDEAVSQELAGGGRLRFDQRLPFVCVYRRRGVEHDDEMEDLIAAEPASLIVPAEPRAARQAISVLQAIVENLAAHFGSFLVLEIWATEGAAETQRVAERNGEPVAQVKYEIVIRTGRVPRFTVESCAAVFL